MTILDRIDAALDKMAEEEMAVRAIYLDQPDMKAFNRAFSKHYGSKVWSPFYREHPVRLGKHSMIYSTEGVATVVKKTTRTNRPRTSCAAAITRLDAISRTRALTLEESLTLERAIKHQRITLRDAARLGIKRGAI